jgi:hypothetical protein
VGGWREGSGLCLGIGALLLIWKEALGPDVSRGEGERAHGQSPLLEGSGTQWSRSSSSDESAIREHRLQRHVVRVSRRAARRSAAIYQNDVGLG